MAKIFIDGSAGTTGLRIHERLKERRDIELIVLDEEHRKDTSSRKECLNSADIAFLCLPDAAAREAVSLTESKNTVIIDTSTAYRTDDAWTYGFPELAGQREKIATSKRISNPGCHASGFISLVAPLVSAGALKKDAKLNSFSLTGYSGGGKKMIADYKNEELSASLNAPRMYGISQSHKHLPEMAKVCGLDNPPIFCPVVSSYYAGMEVTVPLFRSDVKASIAEIEEIYRSYYTGKFIKYKSQSDENGFLSAEKMSGYDDMEISVFGNEERILLVSRFDNLGKGASGSAIQNMNIVLGVDETTGLNLSNE